MKYEENVMIFGNKLNQRFYKKFNKLKILFLIILGIFIFFFLGYFCGQKSFLKKNEKILFSLNNFTSFSQFYEDLILYCIFYDVEKGFYIDIGANDPNHISVTKAFYLYGWNGINIEPLPDKYIELNKYRRRDINLNIGVGEKQDNATLLIRGAGSKITKNISDKRKKSINIQIFKMSQICGKYVPKNEIIQFCKIDVEGNEKNILLGFDFENYRPKVFCIESTLPGTNIPCHNEWEDILLNNDYSFAYQYKINRYYIDNRISNLRERFIKVDESIKIYKEKKRKKKLSYALF